MARHSEPITPSALSTHPWLYTTDDSVVSPHDTAYHQADETMTTKTPRSTVDDAVTLQHRVSNVMLHGVQIVSLTIDNQERLCLAQISSTLLKDFSYNEIHNRRVALGITCVQCTPVQLEILRRAGAMPISSRRCGMITKREAERLVRSFLEEHEPPKLPENFAFHVRHTCGWGCRGQFVPARYNSSRAKCIKCNYCSMFFSPNKFIFHFHHLSDANYRHPDAANFNSWRRHLVLDYDTPNEHLTHAWEDVKAMFNGGSRKRVSTGSATGTGSIGHVEDAYSHKRHGLQADDVMYDAQPPASPYPFLPMPTNVHTAGNMMLPLQFSSPFPMLPAPTSSKPNESTPRCNMLQIHDAWQNKAQHANFCHPLGLLWAKTFSMYPFPNNLPMISNGLEWSHAPGTSRQAKISNIKDCSLAPGATKRAKISNINDCNSAFKPITIVQPANDDDSSRVAKPSSHAAWSNVHGPQRWWDKPERKPSVKSCSSDDVCVHTAASDDVENIRKTAQNIGSPPTDSTTNRCPSSSCSDVSVDDVIDDVSGLVDAPQPSFKNTAEIEKMSCNTSANAADVTVTETATVYNMSKEDLQKELLKMMKENFN